MTQAACMGWSTQGAGYVDLSQYSVPVTLSTARPDGDVVHEVKYGQTLWSIAIQYGTTIEQIKRLNNLSDDTVVQGWKLLVQKGATQPVSVTGTIPGVPSVTEQFLTPRSTPLATTTASDAAQSVEAGGFLTANSQVVVALVISFSILVAGIAGFGRKKS